MKPLGFQIITRRNVIFNTWHWHFLRVAVFGLQGLTRWYLILQSKKDEYGKKHIQSAVLRERQQGEERYCPYHGAGDNQRNCGAVQLQTEHPEDALGREREQGERQEPRARDINLALDNIKAQIIRHYQKLSDREAFVTAEMVRRKKRKKGLRL